MYGTGHEISSNDINGWCEVGQIIPQYFDKKDQFVQTFEDHRCPKYDGCTEECQEGIDSSVYGCCENMASTSCMIFIRNMVQIRTNNTPSVDPVRYLKRLDDGMSANSSIIDNV